MPGERLMCVWEAVSREDPSPGTAPRTSLVRNITNYFYTDKHIRFYSCQFDELFPNGHIDFTEYKQYVNDKLREEDVSVLKVHDVIERMSWERCKDTYRLGALSEGDARNLWEIYVRLVLPNSYPPAMHRDEAIWLAEKIATSVEKVLHPAEFQDKDTYTFEQFVFEMHNTVWNGLSAQVISSSLDDMHGWLVREILMAGWVYKRTRKSKNWTTWLKRWVILTPGKLTYFDGPDCTHQKGEVFVTSHSKIESLPGYQGFVHRLHGRFKITNVPYLEIELSPKDEDNRDKWLELLEDVMEASRQGSTPIQVLLAERFKAHENQKDKVSNRNSVNKAKSSRLSDTERRLGKTRMTAIRARGAVRAVTTPPVTASANETTPLAAALQQEKQKQEEKQSQPKTPVTTEPVTPHTWPVPDEETPSELDPTEGGCCDWLMQKCIDACCGWKTKPEKKGGLV